MRNAIVGAAALAAAALPFNTAGAQKLTQLPVPKDVQVLTYEDGVPITSSYGHQGIQAVIRDGKVSAFVVDYVATAANGTAHKNPLDAPSFVVYTGDRIPEKCPTMLGIAFKYAKTGQYQATIDLSEWPFVPRYLRKHTCLILNNQDMVRDGRIPMLVQQ